MMQCYLFPDTDHQLKHLTLNESLLCEYKQHENERTPLQLESLIVEKPRIGKWNRHQHQVVYSTFLGNLSEFTQLDKLKTLAIDDHTDVVFIENIHWVPGGIRRRE